MKIFGILVVVALALVLVVPGSFAQNVGATGNVSTGGSVVITPGGPGDTIVIGDPISLTKDPIVTTRTIKLFGRTITYIDTIIYWTNGNLCSRSSVIEVRDRQGRLILSTGTTYKYDINGKLISPINTFSHTLSYNRKGSLSGEVYHSYNYDSRHRLLSSDKTVISYTYTAKGELKTKTSSATFYDGRGRKVSSSVSKWSYSYNDNGTLKGEVATYEERGSDNKIRAYSKNVTEYNYSDNGDAYQIHNCYDINGNLVGKFAEISILENGDRQDYNVAYDLGSNGEVQYTHVYDSNFTEVTSLSGDGYRTPVDIIGAIRNPAPQQDDMLIQVNGDIAFNSNRQWDFSNLTVNASGNINFISNDNYDIYVDGDMTMTSDGTIDLSGYRIYVTGNLNISAGTFLADSSTLIEAGGDLTITGDMIMGNITGDTITANNAGEIVLQQPGNIDASGTIVLQGDTETIDRINVTSIGQQQKAQLPQGVSITGSSVTVHSQAMPVLQGGGKGL